MIKIINGTIDDGKYIKQKLIEYNLSKLPEHVRTPNKAICFVMKDESGKVVGGITGSMFWHHLHIDFLWVNDSYRLSGFGSELLEKMEEVAIEKSCRLIFLDTFSFQAPTFYQKHGYKVVGMVKDHPEGYNQYFLEKRLV